MDEQGLQLFLIACGILIALLSLWAQLWITYGKNRGNGRRIAASYGLFWIYTSIFFAMVAISLVLVRQYWEDLPLEKILLSRPLSQFMEETGLSFLVSAFIMGIVNIVESTVSIFIKAIRGRNVFESLVDTNEISKRWLSTLTISAVAILTFTWLGIIYCKVWWYGYIGVVIALIVAFVFLTRRSSSDGVDKHDTLT